MSDLPISLQLEKYIPPDCSKCETASERCAMVARTVLRGNTNLEEAGATLSEDLHDNCPGEIIRPGGWGTTSRSYRYNSEEI